ncbi:MAG: PQQ-binding-like beta-propeller repeat protein [Vicinamibacterales bacterium]
MRKRVTTICCVVGLAVAAASTTRAQSPEPRFPLFPVGVRWTKVIDGALAQPPGFRESRAVLVLDDGKVTAYELDRGTPLWTVEGTATQAPVLSERHVFLVRDRTMVALDLSDGQPVWHLDLTAALSAPLSTISGWLFAVDDAANVTAYRTDDGSRIWTQPIGAPVVQPVSAEGDRVYVARQDGTIVALQLESGTPLWDRRIGGSPQPVLALRDRVYVGSDDNYLYCLRSANGQLDWRWRTGGDIVGRPGFDRDRIYPVSLDTVLRALDRQSGAQRWKLALSLRPTRGLVAGAGTLLVSGAGQTIQGVAMKDGSNAGSVDAGGLLAGPPHIAPAPSLPSSLLVWVARSLSAGTTMTAVTRSLEPAFAPVQPLPDPTVVPSEGSDATDPAAPVAPPVVGEPPAGLPSTGGGTAPVR